MAFESQESWLAGYTYLKSAIFRELKASPVRNTLWQGKLLLCILSHESTSYGDKYHALEMFLIQNSPEDVDPSLYETLWAVMKRHNLFLDVVNFKHLQPKLRRLDRNLPLVPPCSGGLKEHIIRWQERLRLVERVRPLKIPCGTTNACSLEQLMKWWDGQESHHSGFLFDAGPFRPLLIDRTPVGSESQSHIFVCTTWTQLLSVITKYLETALERALLKRDGFVWASATARIIACNLLYRLEPFFSSFPEWPEWLYRSSTHQESSGEPRTSVIKALRQVGINEVPSFLLRPRAALTAVIPASLCHHSLNRPRAFFVANRFSNISSLLLPISKREIAYMVLLIFMLLGSLLYLRG